MILNLFSLGVAIETISNRIIAPADAYEYSDTLLYSFLFTSTLGLLSCIIALNKTNKAPLLWSLLGICCFLYYLAVEWVYV